MLTTEQILSMAEDTACFIGPQTSLTLNRPNAMSALAVARCPIRLLTGSADTSTPFAFAQAAASVAIDGQVLLLEGLGHYALLENPELFSYRAKAGRLLTQTLNLDTECPTALTIT